ncbi:acetylornithine deacetylase (ArgE) [Erwinia sp. OLTSP20]|uniref:acetylornithine deacetylase n=1 Tax=unclassified Erwinia TaxID=2622719 RepID=UPI000C1A4557|nr:MULTISPECIES: acetylornithine deacetylase [unclassified Erwinia]PIJ50422.1 acetylornithine deacetylase [Erwinia sp. OAMSP11]PIJ72493.1 acetylornithine deacetylase (ArgE) [Erwinia sp. OLSSP12]PIJ81731.1 acetylornithine deacetylase (ArgE) [Erwinia sp. OLCASP19]PIJ84324.1 acetylornithine deacetylase (ArgE) [Erwinia sp. OLMTSP26]PIJ86188.1 acetylornithine deacetylase (ArgE) [Erwinia sp. OLMDSP33]
MNNHVETILATLLAFDTTSRESNLALIDYIDDVLQSSGIRTQRFYATDGSKANLYARLGPPGPGGIMLSGHTDVVPVDGQQWTVAPFELTCKNQRYYGRGSADMKGFIACVLAAVPDFLASPLQQPLHLAFSYDEEVGCLGVRSLVDYLRTSQDKPALCIVGEPTEMRPVYGHKGKLAMRCHIHGHACHSAYAPEGVNAIEYAARIINQLSQMGEHLAESQDPRFDPPYSTLQVGLIHGGSALNIVPEHCQFDFEIRHLPDVTLERPLAELKQFVDQQLLKPMQARAPHSDIRFQTLSQYPGLLTDPQSAFAKALAQWSGSEAFSTVAFGTEGGLFDQAGVATLICGPGSMAQGHKADEYVSVEQLQRCMAMLKNLADWMAR